MSLVSVLVALVVIGVVLYLLELVPMDAVVKQVIRVVAILFVVLWLVQATGLVSGLGRLPR